MNDIKACIFDLDGVICDTAKYHFKAWRRLANDLGSDFTEEENEKLKGVSRAESLNLILRWGGIEIHDDEEKRLLTDKKNSWYLEFIERMTPDEILPGVEKFLSDLKRRNIKIGLGSASKNSMPILEKLGLVSYFETIIDGTKTSRSKPDPEVFLLAAKGLNVLPQNAIVFEDAEAGIEAALTGGFYAVGIGQSDVLNEAQMVISGFEHIDFEDICETLTVAVG